MSRLIDADALLDAICAEDVLKVHQCIKLVRQSPTVQREGWVSVDDRLPELYTLVIVFQRMTGFRLMQLQGSANETEWYDENNNYDDSEFDITHWQPLPEPPKE